VVSGLLGGTHSVLHQHAIVIGPTPPGFGVIFPATGCTSAKATSPTSRTVLRIWVGNTIHADVDHDRARLDHIRSHKFRDAHRGDKNVRTAAMLGNVARAANDKS